MKRCGMCNEIKSYSDFWKRNHGDGYQARCKQCSSGSRIKHYKNNRQAEDNRKRVRRLQYREWFRSLKLDKTCSVCGNIDDPERMHWHHRDPSTKLSNLADMVSHEASKKSVLAEINKCDLVCLNCHTEHHLAS